MSFKYNARLCVSLGFAIALAAFGTACSGGGNNSALPPSSFVPTGNIAVGKLPDDVPVAPCNPQADSVARGHVQLMDVSSGDCDNSCLTQQNCVQCPDGTYANVCATGSGAGGDGDGSGGGAGGGNCGPATEASGIRSAQSAGTNCGPTPPTGGDPIALRTPDPGANCYSSPAELGDQWPVNTTDSNHEIVDIIALQANNENNVPEVMGWEYVTPSGDLLQENPLFKQFWQSLGTSLPVIGPAIEAADSGGIVPATSDVANQIKDYLNSHGGKEGSCFSSPLPVEG